MYMRESLIRDIYFGMYDPKCNGRMSENMVPDAFDDILAMSESLIEAAPEDLKEKVRQFADACLSRLTERSEADFEAGYRLGVRLMIAALAQDDA